MNASHTHLARRLNASQTSFGRGWIHCTLGLTRWAWAILQDGGRLTKRLLDIVIALVALTAAAPLFAVVVLLVKSDGGPAFFRQTRVGRRGREFGMLKFRSMCVDAEAKLAGLLASNEKGQGITFKMANDPRVTRVGRFLRRASLDELPQLINVLRGEMSIVGPRPPLPREVALYRTGDRKRLLVTPGITCFWQVGEVGGGRFEVGDRNRIDFDQQVRLDVRYIESQSVGGDLWLMLKTLPAMLLGR